MDFLLPQTFPRMLTPCCPLSRELAISSRLCVMELTLAMLPLPQLICTQQKICGTWKTQDQILAPLLIRCLILGKRLYNVGLYMRQLSLQKLEKAYAQILGNKCNAFYLYSAFMFIKHIYRCYFIGSGWQAYGAGISFILEMSSSGPERLRNLAKATQPVSESVNPFFWQRDCVSYSALSSSGRLS